MIRGAVVLVGAYLLGSVLFGIVALRLWTGKDPRRAGSGNPGATNVLRLGGWLPALVAFALDAGKGAAAVWLGRMVSPEGALAALAGFAAVLGHAFPLFHRFRGGKGVATGLGAFLILAPVPAAIAVLVFCGTVAAFRYVSLGSLVGALALIVSVGVREGPGPTAVTATVVGFLVGWRHRENLSRLARGLEPRLGDRPPGVG